MDKAQLWEYLFIQRDSWESFTSQAYATAMRAANEAQRAHLEAEIQRQGVKTH